MLDPQHARRERAGVVAREHRDRPLRDDSPAIVHFVDEVDGDATHANAGLDRRSMHALAIHPGPAEGGQ